MAIIASGHHGFLSNRPPELPQASQTLPTTGGAGARINFWNKPCRKLLTPSGLSCRNGPKKKIDPKSERHTMSTASAPNGDEPHIRAIVFKEGAFYIAQALEYDISAQSATIGGVIDRLELTLEAEFEACEAEGKSTKDCIGPAQNYYHDLWGDQSLKIERVKVPSPASITLELRLAA
jgi:hypothetical protein